MPESPKPLHIRVDGDAIPVIQQLVTTDSFPQYKGLSAAQLVNQLLRGSVAYQAAVAQIAAERHPRPGAQAKR